MNTSLLTYLKSIVLVLWLCAATAWAQSPLTPVHNAAIGLDSTLAYVFEHARLGQVPSGYLQDLAIGFEDLDLYNGAQYNENILYPDTWRRLYATLMTGACNTSAQALPDITQLNKKLRQAAGTDTVPVLGFDWAYHAMDSLAIDKGLATVVNEQVIVSAAAVGQVYKEQRLFAVCQGLRMAQGPAVVFKLDPAFWLNNTGQGIAGLEVDFDDGQGFVPLSAGGQHRVYYTQAGLKNITWRVPGAVVLPNGGLQLYRYSYSQLWVAQGGSQTAPSYEEAPDQVLNFPTSGGGLLPVQPYKGRVAQATVSVSYGSGNNTGFLQKPLIVLEGFDVWHLTNPNDPDEDYDYRDYILGPLGQDVTTPIDTGFAAALHQAGYDLVFVNWARGATYIQAHAYLTAHILQWVNQNKALGGSTEPNVLLGYSMGGLVGRYALAAMEQQGYYTQQGLSHDVRLFASIDAPHQGAVAPLGAMAMVQHLGASKIRTNWPFERAKNLTEFSQDLRAGYFSYNSLAAKQMLRYRVVGNDKGLRVDSTEHVAFRQELQALGYPQQSRNIALSNGSQCGLPQQMGFDQQLIDVQGSVSTNLLADLLLAGIHAPGGLATIRPAVLNTFRWVFQEDGINQVKLLPVMAFIPNLFTRHEIRPDFKVQSMGLPGQSNTIYSGKFTVKKCILRFICISKTLLNQSLNAPAQLLRWEQAPGGAVTDEFVDVGQEPLDIENSALIKPALEQTIELPATNFVPTVSALDLGSGQTAFTEADLYRPYGPQNPPPASLASPFDAIFTASRGNEAHILSTRLNATWLFSQMEQDAFTQDCRTWCNSTPQIATSTIYCQGDRLVAQVTGAPPNSRIRWNVPFGLELVGSTIITNPIEYIITAQNEVFNLTAELTGDCGSFVLEKMVAVQPNAVSPERLGSGPVGTTNGQLEYCPNSEVTLTVTGPVLAPGLDTEWQIPCGTILNQSKHSVRVKWQGGPCTQNLRVRTLNQCGQKSAWLTVPITLIGGANCNNPDLPADGIALSAFQAEPPSIQLSIRPNPTPAGQAVRIQLMPYPGKTALQGATLYLYNTRGFRVLKRPWPKGKASIKVNAQRLPPGIYTLKLVYSQGTASTRWVKQ